MRHVIHGIGGLSHAAFRNNNNSNSGNNGTFAASSVSRDVSRDNEDVSTGFVDGDLVERFIKLSPEMQRVVMDGPGRAAPIRASVQEVIRIVEEMSRLHS